MEIVGNCGIDAYHRNESNRRGAWCRGCVGNIDSFGGRKYLRVQTIPNLLSFNPDNKLAADAGAHCLVSNFDDLGK